MKNSKKIKKAWEFLGGPVVKNLPYNAGDTGLIPGQGTKNPHATGQLSPRATTAKLACLERAHVPKLQSPRALEPAHHNYRAHAPWSPHATTTEEKTSTPQLERSLRPTTKDPACLNEDPPCHN